MVASLEGTLANSLSKCVSIACFFHSAFRFHTHSPSSYLLNSKAKLSLATADVYFHLHQKLFIPISCGFKLILPYRHQPFLFQADCFPAVQAGSPGKRHTKQSRQAGRHTPPHFCHLKPEQPPAAPELRFQRNSGV